MSGLWQFLRLVFSWPWQSWEVLARYPVECPPPGFVWCFLVIRLGLWVFWRSIMEAVSLFLTTFCVIFRHAYVIGKHSISICHSAKKWIAPLVWFGRWEGCSFKNMIQLKVPWWLAYFHIDNWQLDNSCQHGAVPNEMPLQVKRSSSIFHIGNLSKRTKPKYGINSIPEKCLQCCLL